MSWVIPEGPRRALDALPRPHYPGLPARLAAVAVVVPRGIALADVGTDHGLLPAALLAEGHVRHATAVDSSAEALAAARVALAPEVARGRAAVVLGDGLAAVPVGSVECVVLAGLGGPNTVAILARGFELGHTPARVVVQALGGEGLVRRALVAAGYGLVEEALVVDGRRMFLTLAFERAGGVRSLVDDAAVHVGPLLAQRRDALLGAWLDVQRAWLAPRVAAIAAAGDPALPDARARLEAVESVGAMF